MPWKIATFAAQKLLLNLSQMERREPHDIVYIYNKVYALHPEVSTDSRHCPEGSMFFALRGERFDGNAYASRAIDAGCAVAVVDDASVAASLGERAILVDDVLQTLQALAAEHRRHFRGPVLQITGTNGKTTTKELIAAVLSRKYNVLYTQGNLNNHIGVPLTLLRLRPEHEVAIIETGANHPGEIAALTQIVRPDMGLVTNVGRAHLEGFGSFEGVKRTKGELYDYLIGMPGKSVFYNPKDPDITEMVTERCRYSSCDNTFTYVNGGVIDDGREQLTFWWEGICHPSEKVISHKTHTVATQLVGRYNVNNLLAAATVGQHLNVNPDDIDAALEAYTPSLGRSQLKHTAHNELIVDAYNANPTSMLVALDNFSHIRHDHKMVILGDMRELGYASLAEHRRIVETVAESGVSEAWFVGKEFARALETEPGSTIVLPSHRRAEGVKAMVLTDVAAAKERIAAAPPTDALILIKGSNGTHLYELPDLL